ncbi:MAG: hypothetical protein GY724_23970 [Actinomycetia bacterium]|nr:hypothetical protein [Actinomycetes bacterium]
MKRSLALLSLVAALGLIASGCGDDKGSADTSTDTTDTGGTADSTSEDGQGSDDDDSDVSSTSSTETTSTSAADGGTASTDDVPLPGDPFDIGPPAGEQLDVVSVGHDDVLNFRTRPEASAPIVDTVAPLSNTPAVLSSGEGRLFDSSAWWKVTVGGQEAWANFAFLGTLGRTDDILEDLEAGPASTEATTIEAIVTSVAASRSGGPEPRVTYMRPITSVGGGGMAATVDVVGLGDDAVKGERFVFMFESVGTGYRLEGAERTVICGRGATDGGLCL